ncbi:protein kinase domain-containing protein [Dietzia sp. 179-F 9C3 NHS]|uniref:protein kinase domain-containing protein n=1 Tax=Dietzia sp. 179-F 9C3 NHS TaxID=3374295 RepID=UPI00387947C9
MSLTSGAVLSDRYRLLRHIATGGMGAVWEADDAVLDRHVAVKILKPEFSSDAEFVERFRAEAKVTAQISHPGIAAVYDYGQVDDPVSSTPLSYLVMELVVGEPLSDVLTREGTVPLRHTLDMLEQTGRALNAAHAIGLVHRDVKPGNILITPAGQVKLTDFGIAKSMGSATVTQTGMVVGTAQYIAPEQAMGHATTPAGDVYSLGVVGYECLAGRRPFVADSPVTVAMMHVRDTPPPLPGSLPGPVRRLVGYAMAKDPNRRYPDGRAFAEAVADVRAGRSPRPPVAFATATGTAATTVLPEDPPAGGPTPTRAYTRLDSRPTGPRTAPQQSRPGRPAGGPPSRRPAPPPTSPRRPAQRRRGGCAMWFLVITALVLAIALAGAIVLSNSGVFGPNGLFGGSTTSPTTSTPRTTTTVPAPPSPAPEPEPEPEPTPEPAPPTAPEPPAGQDLQDMLDSLTAELSDLVPPGGNAGGAPRNNGNGAGGGADGNQGVGGGGGE